jgi:hypothetical protein
MVIKENWLLVDKVSSYTADNTNVNYGKYNSVFRLYNSSKKILKSNCLAHIVHNAMKHTSDYLDIDVETIVLEVFSHFSVSANCREELKEYFAFVDVEWEGNAAACHYMMAVFGACS